MNRFIEREDRRQAILLPDRLEDYVTDDNPVRVSWLKDVSLHLAFETADNTQCPQRDGHAIEFTTELGLGKSQAGRRAR